MDQNQLGTPVPLAFDGTTFRLIRADGTVWVRGADIGRALGYRNPANSIYRVYERNVGEFTESMTMLLPVADPQAQADTAEGGLECQSDTAGQVREVRLFSARGAHLVAMFARTPRAAQFRHWVLDVLEGVCAAQAQPALTFSQEMQCIRTSVWLMEKVAAARGLERAEQLYLRLMRVNRRLGMPTMAFSALALSWRQGELPLAEGDDKPAAGAGH